MPTDEAHRVTFWVSESSITGPAGPQMQIFQKQILQISENPSNFLGFPEIPAKFHEICGEKSLISIDENSAEVWQNLQKKIEIFEKHKIKF